MKKLSSTLGAWTKNNASIALVIDGDRTLGPFDTGRLVGSVLGLNTRIRGLFELHGYSSHSFELHAAIWSEVSAGEYLDVIEQVTPEVTMFDAWKGILAQRHDREAYIVTAGVPQIWRGVLEREGLGHVKVLGGLHENVDSFYVTPGCKEWLVRELRAGGAWTMAAGDSEIDLRMMAQADLAIWIADLKGSPRLQKRLREVPDAIRLSTDDRSFPAWPVIDGVELDARILRAGGE